MLKRLAICKRLYHARAPAAYRYMIIGGGARLMVSAVCGKTCIFFIQDKLLGGGAIPPSRLLEGQSPPAPPTAGAYGLYAAPPNKKMSDLPSDRVKAGSPPFTYVGVDIFGPFLVKQGRSEVKGMGASSRVSMHGLYTLECFI